MLEALDYTFNKHNNTYNVRVIKKIIALQITASLDIESVRRARTAFFLFEGEICNGVPLDPDALLEILRLTTKSVAPSKLQEWIRQTSPDIASKVQLYEFLDLLQLCEGDDDSEGAAASAPTTNSPNERNGLYQLQDSSFLLSPDRANQKQLDEEYETLLSSLQAQHETAFHDDARDNLDERMGNRSRKVAFQTSVQTHEDRYLALKEAIGATNATVKASQASSRRPDPRPRQQISDAARRMSVGGDRQQRAFDFDAHDDLSKLR
jgi:hypothetical protein